jgi:hypothetical protein
LNEQKKKSNKNGLKLTVILKTGAYTGTNIEESIV